MGAEKILEEVEERLQDARMFCLELARFIDLRISKLEKVRGKCEVQNKECKKK